MDAREAVQTTMRLQNNPGMILGPAGRAEWPGWKPEPAASLAFWRRQRTFLKRRPERTREA